MNKKSFAIAIAGSLFVVAGHAAESTEPAVSAPNAKLSAQGGNKRYNMVDASFTFPLTHSLGAQLDLGSGRHEFGNFNGYGGHLFWRDPAKGLLGLGLGHQTGSFGHNSRLSVQAERFWQDFTLRGHLGQERSRIGQFKGSDAFYRATGTWYANPDLALHLRAGRSHGTDKVGLGAEWQLGGDASRGYAVFAELDKTRARSTQILVGFRVYFDGAKSLKSRHRTADPESTQFVTFNSTCPAGYSLEQGGAAFLTWCVLNQ